MLRAHSPLAAPGADRNPASWSLRSRKCTGFVFKIHANMDPNHRDRIAFLKICSGTFERNTNYLHVRQRQAAQILRRPRPSWPQKKSIIDFAYPGDIVGLHDTGNFKIGDTLHRRREAPLHGHSRRSPPNSSAISRTPTR